MSDYKITKEEYEDAQNVVWDYEEQLKVEANEANKDNDQRINYEPVLAVRALITKYKGQLKIMDENRSKWDEEGWTDAEIQECDRLMAQLAGVIRDLRALVA